MRHPFYLMVLICTTGVHAQISFSKDVSSSESCTFEWYCDTTIPSGGSSRAVATMNGNAGRVVFGNSKQVTGVAPITARVERSTPDRKEHLLDCRDEKVYYSYFHEAQVGPSLVTLTGQQPEPPPIMPCSCDVTECEACFEDDPLPTAVANPMR